MSKEIQNEMIFSKSNPSFWNPSLPWTPMWPWNPQSPWDPMQPWNPQPLWDPIQPWAQPLEQIRYYGTIKEVAPKIKVLKKDNKIIFYYKNSNNDYYFAVYERGAGKEIEFNLAEDLFQELRKLQLI